MERAEAGLVRQRLDRQVFTEMGFHMLLHPSQTPGVERAAGSGAA